MASFDLKEHSHRRYNPMTAEWVQVSPHRAKRPWQGQTEKIMLHSTNEYDPSCYLCPRNVRANGEINPNYNSTFSFANDFAAIVEEIPEGNFSVNDLLIAKPEQGICRVVCFSPRHDLTVAELSIKAVKDVIELWIVEYKSLAQKKFINYIQIFENKGAVMGCSNPHPHGQIWAQTSIPVEPYKKSHHQLEYYRKNKRTMLEDYLTIEVEQNDRIVFQNDHFVVVAPFWAVWPFETMIIPKRPMANITQMTDPERIAFAAAYKGIAVRYDNLFQVSFPYSAGIHQAPTDGAAHPEWHWHMVFYPPLLRSSTIKKFMVGYELLANPQRDVTPEWSADRLRSASEIHYKDVTQVV